MQKRFYFFILTLLTQGVFAQGALFLPNQLAQLIAERSSISQSSLAIEMKLKQAFRTIGKLNNRCTATLVSPNGLVITSLHCLQSYLQDTIQIKQGFWAASLQEEKEIQGLQLSFEIERKDVTELIRSGVSENMPENERVARINRNSIELVLSQKLPKGQSARILNMNNGSRYHLIIQSTFTDIRLVGFPTNNSDIISNKPSLSPNDFVLLRVYTQEGKLPANFNKNNQNLTNEHYLHLSDDSSQASNNILSSIGYPSNTDFHSTALEMEIKVLRPLKVEYYVDSVSLAASINAGVDTSQLKSLIHQANTKKQQLDYIKQQNIIGNKRALELKYLSQAQAAEYQIALSNKDLQLEALRDLFRAQSYATYSFQHISLYQRAAYIERFLRFNDEAGLKRFIKRKHLIQAFLEKESSKPANTKEQAVFQACLPLYFNNLKAHQLSPIAVEQIKAVGKDYSQIATIFYQESILNKPDLLLKLLLQSPQKFIAKLNKDIAYRFFRQLIINNKTRITVPLNTSLRTLNPLTRKLLEATETLSTKAFPYDADGSMRISIGDFTDMPELAISEGIDKTAFIQSNVQSSGASSGSPLINSNGEIIGIHIKRPINSNLTDYFFDPMTHRSIAISSASLITFLRTNPNCQRIMEEIGLN